MKQLRTELIHSNPDNSSLGRVSQAGYVRDSLGVWNMRVLGSYAVVYLLEGEGSYRDVNGLELKVRAGDFFFIFPEIGHEYGPGQGGRWSEIYFVFDGPAFELWRKAGLIKTSEPLQHAGPVEFWLNKLEAVVVEPGSAGPMAAEMMVCRLQAVLTGMLMEARGADKKDADALLVAKACSLLESDLSRPLSMPQLAALLGLGKSFDSFRKRFVELTGMPPARFRNKRIMDKACQLMMEGRATDKQIADQLGFCDPFHFSKRFKGALGCSPTEFRARLPKAR